MTFTTLTFILFLALFFPLYWGLRNRTAQNALIVLASYFFYGWWDFRFCALMLIASLLDYGVGLGLNRAQNPGTRRLILTLGLAGNIGMLGFFKYFNFFAENFRVMAAGIGWQVDPVTLHIVLPVGISFYTFQTMCYSIDVYRGRLRATPRLIEYLAYVSFFPQLVAGPIERATNLLPQFFAKRSFQYDRAVNGCRQILWGCFKKMVIADNLGPLVDEAFADPSRFSGGELAMATLFFAFQIYCDFSAYSDIAIGVARLLGFELMRNFAYPYFSQSMGEFWRRWHISLTTWFKDYVYFPLGGNRVSPPRWAFNVMATFLLSGFWHGASWSFVVWGALNGLAILPTRLSAKPQSGRTSEAPGGNEDLPRLRTLGRMALTFGVVCLGWVFFRAKTLADAALILRKITSSVWSQEGLVDLLAFAWRGHLAAGNLAILLLLVAVEWFSRRQPHPLCCDRLPAGVRWLIYTALVWSILCLGTFGGTQFIYFRF